MVDKFTKRHLHLIQKLLPEEDRSPLPFKATIRCSCVGCQEGARTRIIIINIAGCSVVVFPLYGYAVLMKFTKLVNINVDLIVQSSIHIL